MQIKDTPWQGDGGYWQPLFIREQIMAIAPSVGYTQVYRRGDEFQLNCPSARRLP